MLNDVKNDILLMATVFVIQDIPGTKLGAPKINIIGAREFGDLKVLLPENSQIILSPAYVIQTLKQKLKEYYLNGIIYDYDMWNEINAGPSQL